MRDVTLVWKAGFEHVAQYGISFSIKQVCAKEFRSHLKLVPDPQSLANKTI